MKDREQTLAEFQSLVNMDADELEQWLQTEESQSAGMKREGEAEAVGHQSGRHIVDILRKLDEEYKARLTEEDVAHMSKVVGYIKRHRVQRHNMEGRSEEEVEHTRWTHSLKNWAHDPLKDEDVKRSCRG